MTSVPAPSPVPDPDRRLALILCACEVLGMAGTMTLPALLPALLAEWGLGAAEGGWLVGIAQAGYVAAVPLLVTWTDRIDPRRIYIACTVLAALSVAGFAWLADGFWSAMLFRALGGVALAGTYMPGLRILSDHATGPRARRYMSFYTASFALGSSVSVLLGGWVAEAGGWRMAFWVSALATLLAVLLAFRIPAADPDRPAPEGNILDVRPVLRHRPAMGYILAYTVHCWELFGLRGWLVAFLGFAALSAGTAIEPGTLASIAAFVLLLSLPASILGNEAAERWGRTRFLTFAMWISAALACVVGFTAGLPLWLVVAVCSAYAVTVNWDSASLTVGAVTEAVEGRRGATMAVHSFLGFTGAFVGPVVFGLILDMAGGPDSRTAWGLAFLSFGAVVALGPLFLRRSARCPGRV